MDAELEDILRSLDPLLKKEPKPRPPPNSSKNPSPINVKREPDSSVVVKEESATLPTHFSCKNVIGYESDAEIRNDRVSATNVNKRGNTNEIHFRETKHHHNASTHLLETCNDRDCLKIIPTTDGIRVQHRFITCMEPKHKKMKIMEINNNDTKFKTRNTFRNAKNDTTPPLNVTKKSYKYHINELHKWYLSKIFGYINTRDRKNVKQVCRLWYEAVHSHELCKHEKFMISGIYNHTESLNYLKQIKCQFMNLEFNCVNLPVQYEKFFEEHGRYIKSMTFVDSSIDRMLLYVIISECSTLEHLAFIFKNHEPNNITSYCCDPVTLKFMANENVVRSSLKSLHLEFCTSKWFNNEIIEYLFKIYPEISEFSFHCKLFNSIKGCSESVSKNEFGLGAILDKLSNDSNKIEKLSLDVDLRKKNQFSDGLLNFVTWDSSYKNLKSLELTIDVNRMDLEIIRNFLIHQDLLMSLSIDFIGYYSSSQDHRFECDFANILNSILDNSVYLRSFSVKYFESEVTLNETFFMKIIASKLKELTLNFKKVMTADDKTNIKIMDKLCVNKSLKKLNIREIPTQYERLLLRMCQNLTILVLHNLKDEVLKDIWTYQEKLKVLKLHDVSQCSSRGFPNVDGFSKLKDLEYIHIDAITSEWACIDVDVFADFQFFTLRTVYIDLDVDVHVGKKLINQLELSEDLLYVSIALFGIPQQLWLFLGRKWRTIKYLRMVDKSCAKYKNKDYENYFQRCPTLQVLVHESKERENETYYRDSITGEIKRKRTTIKYKLSSENVGGVKLDWLWY